jgi:cytochrome b involved in lipid metabolism
MDVSYDSDDNYLDDDDVDTMAKSSTEETLSSDDENNSNRRSSTGGGGGKKKQRKSRNQYLEAAEAEQHDAEPRSACRASLDNVEENSKKTRQDGGVVVKDFFGNEHVYYSAEQVARHNSADDCWVTLNHRVIDLTEFIAYHPGGRQALVKSAGQDISHHTRFHSNEMMRIARLCEIGRLARPSQVDACSIL